MRKTPVSVTMPELKEILNRYLGAGERLNYAVKIVGHPGVGKSDAVYQTAVENNFLFIDTRLAFKENVDLGGYPVPDHAARRMVYYRPRFIPPEEVPPDKNGILWFLDEANRAHPTVIQTLFQIITEGVCGEHPLPARTAVVLAGNLGEEDQTAVMEFDDAALEGRLAVFHLKPDAENWLAWARREGIHPSVVRYITRYPERLWDEVHVHPNPRGWHQVSRALTVSHGIRTHGELARRLDGGEAGVLEKVVSALIGPAAARDFLDNVVAPRLLTTSQVLAGDAERLSAVEAGEVSAEDLLWALTGALGSLRDAREASPGGLAAGTLAALANTLAFVRLTRADMRVSFFHQLVRQCALFTQLPRALALMEDRQAAEALSREFAGMLEER